MRRLPTIARCRAGSAGRSSTNSRESLHRRARAEPRSLLTSGSGRASFSDDAHADLARPARLPALPGNDIVHHGLQRLMSKDEVFLPAPGFLHPDSSRVPELGRLDLRPRLHRPDDAPPRPSLLRDAAVGRRDPRRSPSAPPRCSSRAFVGHDESPRVAPKAGCAVGRPEVAVADELIGLTCSRGFRGSSGGTHDRWCRRPPMPGKGENRLGARHGDSQTSEPRRVLEPVHRAAPLDCSAWRWRSSCGARPDARAPTPSGVRCGAV